MKQKTCKVCKTKFTPERPFQTWCSYDCAIELAQKRIETKKEKDRIKASRELKEAKERNKTRAKWMKEAQTVFNAFIRARDKDLPCISSGRFTGAFDAGHYRSVGSCPELRFNELNCHRQTVHDNQHLHGNLIEYRKRLIDRIGLDKVEWIESKHEPKHYSIEDLKQIKAEYKQKLKEIAK